MKRRFFLKLLLIIPVFFLVFGFNWFVDPVHLRDANQYEQGIAQMILAEKNVTNIWNPNEAVYLEAFIEGLPQRKEVLVFGSSRSKLLRSDSFPGLTFFNNSISGGGLNDYLALYELYRQKNLIPSVVVLELSPWILNGAYASVWQDFNAVQSELEQRILHPELATGGPLRIGRTTSIDWAEFLSPGYFQTSFYSWLNGTLKPAENKANYFEYQPGSLPVGETILSDGSAIYPERVQNSANIEKVTAAAIEYAQNPAGLPQALDPQRQKMLESFVQYLQNQGVQVVFYLPPYHPKTYELLMNSEPYKIIAEAQQYFTDLAQRTGVTLVGSYNPAELALDNLSFFDGSHPTQEAVRTLFSGRIAGGQPSAVTPAVADIQVTGIDNPNGLEVVDNKPVFWIGQGSTCFNIHSSRAGIALLNFSAQPGPAIPADNQRHLLIQAANGYSTTLTLAEYPEIQIPIPVVAMQNEVCLTPLDRPVVLEQPNGDRRPLLLGVSDVRVQLLPQSGPTQSAFCELTFRDGWQGVERDGSSWMRWNNGRAQLSALVSSPTTVTLQGNIISLQRPNDIDALLNGERITVLKIDWKEWAFKPFTPFTLTLKAGLNSLEFISHNAPITQPNDSRLLAVALQNLQMLKDDNQPCVIKQ